MADDDRFYVQKLRMQNFRCFEDVELGPFDPHFNLLVGENGAGKSSILLALADLFRPLASAGGILQSDAILNFDDAKRLADNNRNGVYSESLPPWSLSADFLTSNVTQNVSDVWTANPTYENQPEVRGYVENNRGVTAPFKTGFNYPSNFSGHKLLALYRTDRRFQSPAEPRNLLIPVGPGEGYIDWLNAGAWSDRLREWLKDATLISLQSGQADSPDLRGLSVLLNLASTALSVTFDGVTKAFYSGLNKDIVLQWRDGSVTRFLQMSDGQRALAGLVLDLVRRCFVLNGRTLGERTLIGTPGLVLIDEIDLHLHPKWQRQIVPALKKVFPKIQFFATTHSPQVIGECKPEEIVLLRDGQQVHPPGSFGMDSNWILECVMDAPERNEIVKKQIDAVSQAIDEGRLEDAKVGIAELRRELPAVAPDIVGAENYIWNVEHDPGEAAE